MAVSGSTAISPSSDRRSGRGSAGDEVLEPDRGCASEPDELVRALLAPRARTERDLRLLARQAQRELAGAVVLEYEAGNLERAARPPMAARDQLVEIALPAAVEHAPGRPLRDVLAAVVQAVYRFDPDGPTGFSEWMPTFLKDVLVEQDPGPAERSEGPAAQQLSVRVREAVTRVSLTPAQREVLRLRFGLDGSEACSLAAAAEQLGWDRAQVRSVEARTVAQLRRHPSVAALRPATASPSPKA